MRERYDRLRGDSDETRREYNERLDHGAPLLIVPESGSDIWEWFYTMSDRVQRVHDGHCVPVPPSEYLAYFTLTRDIVNPREYAILFAMDDAFCEVTNEELAAAREKANDRSSNMPPPQPARRRR